MPVYEYYCRQCAATFEKLRPMRDAEAPAACPSGHVGAARTISAFAVHGLRSAEAARAEAPAAGGCCGGGACACGAGGFSPN